MSGTEIVKASESLTSNVSSHNLTNIAVSQEVKRAIASRGTAGQSFNDVLKRVLGIEENNTAGREAHNQT